jgi:hypothetical protein
MQLRNAACGFALIYLHALPELFISPTRLPQQSLEKAAWKDLARHAAFVSILFLAGLVSGVVTVRHLQVYCSTIFCLLVRIQYL